MSSTQMVLLDLSDETCQSFADLLHVVKVIGKWPATASCIVLFLLPKTLDNDRIIALLAIQIPRVQCRNGTKPMKLDAPIEARGAEYSLGSDVGVRAV